MRPHPQNVESRTTKLARARMVLENGLGWLRGYPLGGVGSGKLEWQAVPEPRAGRDFERVVIDREHLRRAQFATKKLTGEYSRVFGRLVGDRRAWVEATEAALEILKRRIHRDEPLIPVRELLASARVSPSDARRIVDLADARPTLVPLLRALVWVHWTRPSEVRRATRCVSRHASELEVVVDGTGEERGVALALRLVDLERVEGERRVAGIVAALGDRRLYDTVLASPQNFDEKQISASVEHWLSGRRDAPLRLPQPPDITLPRRLAGRVESMTAMGPSTRRRALELLDCLLPCEVIGLWESWWERYRDVDHRLARLRRLEPESRDAFSQASTCLEGLRRLAVDPVAAYRDRDVSRAVEALSRDDSSARHRKIVATLRSLPEMHERRLVRVSFAAHWHGLVTDYSPARRVVARVIVGLRALLRGRSCPMAALGPWRSVWRTNRPWDCPDDELLRDTTEQVLVDEFFRALALLVPRRAGGSDGDDGVDSDSASVLMDLVAETRSADAAARLLRELQRRRAIRTADQLSAETLRAVVRLSGGVARTVADLVARCDGYFGDWEASRDLLALESVVDSRAALRELLLHEDRKRLRHLAARIRLLGALGVPVAALSRRRVKSGSAAWIDRYPEDLRRALKRLAREDPAASRNAGRVLGASFPDRARLDREIAALRERIALSGAEDSSLEKRLEGLVERARTGEARISVERLERLEGKIHHRRRLATVEQWEAIVDEKLRAALSDAIGVPADDEWLDDAELLGLLAHLARLRASSRRLALRLLRVRRGPPPWDLRDAPANERFLVDLRRQGIDPQPWVDGIEPVVEEVDGVAWALALEDDPLEIFRMGGYFGTCLSPGDCNFFSTVSNAADINKRVLYARDASGSVCARSLLALTSEGGMLVFHAYSRSRERDFAASAQRFAQRLAERMGASCVSRGHVETLESSEWWDDGPVDITGRAELLAGSGFRRRLATVEPAALVAWITESLGTQELDAHTLLQVLSLDEIADRPELVRPLLPAVRAIAHGGVETILCAVALLITAGDLQDARALLREFATGRRRRDVPVWRWDEIAQKLVDADDPATALRVLRRTRRRGVRSWEGDDDWRLLTAADAHHRLHRLRTALRLYRELCRRGRQSDLCQDRVTLLERLLAR